MRLVKKLIFLENIQFLPYRYKTVLKKLWLGKNVWISAYRSSKLCTKSDFEVILGPISFFITQSLHGFEFLDMHPKNIIKKREHFFVWLYWLLPTLRYYYLVHNHMIKAERSVPIKSFYLGHIFADMAQDYVIFKSISF